MTRILFVDDEARILAGLEGALRRHRHKWEMVFASTPEIALEAVAAAPFDVVVSDMRMPRMDGAELLSLVRMQNPDAVRMILSGYSERGALLRAVPVAHQFIAKPCSAPMLESILERACALRTMVTDDAVRARIHRVDRLPSSPRVLAELLELVRGPHADAPAIAKLVLQDIAMSAKILQLVNSAFFGRGRPMTRIEEAVAHLGVDTMKSLVLSVPLFRATDDDRRAPQIETIQRHSRECAEIAAAIAAPSGATDAFTAGLFHDIGALVVATDVTLAPNETDITHAEGSGYLLALWGLPTPIVDAVAHHHTPSRATSSEREILTAIHVADALSHELDRTPTFEAATLDIGYLTSVGARDTIEASRAIARERVEAMRARSRE